MGRTTVTAKMTSNCIDVNKMTMCAICLMDPGDGEETYMLMIRRVDCLSVITDFTFIVLLSGSSMADIIAHTVGAQVTKLI